MRLNIPLFRRAEPANTVVVIAEDGTQFCARKAEKWTKPKSKYRYISVGVDTDGAMECHLQPLVTKRFNIGEQISRFSVVFYV